MAEHTYHNKATRFNMTSFSVLFLEFESALVDLFSGLVPDIRSCLTVALSLLPLILMMRYHHV